MCNFKRILYYSQSYKQRMLCLRENSDQESNDKMKKVVKLKVSLIWRKPFPAPEILKIYYEFVDRIDESVLKVTVWHHKAPPRDARQ